MTPDLINGAFEFAGAAITCANLWRLYRDKQVHGFVPHLGWFYTFWGAWNCWYYPHLNQLFSFMGTVAITISNGLYTLLALHYSRRNK